MPRTMIVELQGGTKFVINEVELIKEENDRVKIYDNHNKLLAELNKGHIKNLYHIESEKETE